MDIGSILNAANQLSIPTLALLIGGGVVYISVKVIGWGSEVTKLLGNHLRHDLADQTDTLKRIERGMEEQTQVLRAIGRAIFDANRKDQS